MSTTPLRRTPQRHTVLQFIADNPGQVRQSSGILLSLKADFYGGTDLETTHGIKLWKRACADMLKARLITVKRSQSRLGSGPLELTDAGKAALADWNRSDERGD